MAITANDTVHKFVDTLDLITVASPAALAHGAMSGQADAALWTNTDGAPQAELFIIWQYSTGTIASNPWVYIYARLLNIDGAVHTDIPTLSFKDRLVGKAKLNEAKPISTDQYSNCTILLPNSKVGQEYEFYFLNESGVQFASWSAKLRGKTFGPK